MEMPILNDVFKFCVKSSLLILANFLHRIDEDSSVKLINKPFWISS
jgi:hypothetical protein